MHYATSGPSSPMASYIWASYVISQRICSLLSVFFAIHTILLIIYACVCREKCKHQVFATLLQMVPGLEERLMNGDHDDGMMAADMVSDLYECNI
jgi:hypothetical protein